MQKIIVNLDLSPDMLDFKSRCNSTVRAVKLATEIGWGLYYQRVVMNDNFSMYLIPAFLLKC